jgi:leader peptidase (prepilin peptidase) / N-methyltransferase
MADFIAIFTQNQQLLAVTAVLLGLIVGSFLNVVIVRLPLMLKNEWTRESLEWLHNNPTGAFYSLHHQKETPDIALDKDPVLTSILSVNEDKNELTLSFPSSTCPHCGHRIRFYENIPLLSYLFLGGKCSHCQEKISRRYPLIEGVTALLTVAVALQFGMTWQLPAALVLTWALIALALIDYDTQLLPDTITLPLLWLGLTLSLFGIFTNSSAALIGAIAGYLSLWSVFQLFRLLTGKEGMGYGDFKLLALFGAWLGWQALPQIVLLAATAGAIFGGIVLISGRLRREQPLPFGPFLAGAGWISLLWGGAINTAYLQFSGLG